MSVLMTVPILPMRIRSAVGVGIASFMIVSAAQAATFDIVFYQRLTAGWDLDDNFMYVGGGTFEIADDAISPGSLVLFEAANFLSFDVVIDTTIDDARRYTLGEDDFPPTPPSGYSQGILFDDNAQPLRFDTPATTTSNSARICDENDCTQPNRLTARLTLFDSDSFDLGYIADGTIAAIDNLMQNYPGEPISRLGGYWIHNVGSDIGGASQNAQGLYEIFPASPAPPPCLGDFEPDGDVDGLDAATQAQGSTGVSTAEFAQHYGRNDCPANGSS